VKQVGATAALIPTPPRPVVKADPGVPAAGYTLQSNAPAVVETPAPQADPPQVSSPAKSPQTPSPPRIAGRAKDHSPPADNPISSYKEARLPPDISVSKEARLPPPQAKPQISSDVWEVRTTSKATYFNLGGHVDGNGVVDSLASGYLREALMKHKNYPKLPAQIQTFITRPTINLAKIAGYRALLGINDKEMEEKQGVTFVRISGSRSIDIAGSDAAEFDAADFDASPIDLGALEKMDLDLRRKMTQGSAP